MRQLNRRWHSVGWVVEGGRAFVHLGSRQGEDERSGMCNGVEGGQACQESWYFLFRISIPDTRF